MKNLNKFLDSLEADSQATRAIELLVSDYNSAVNSLKFELNKFLQKIKSKKQYLISKTYKLSDAEKVALLQYMQEVELEDFDEILEILTKILTNFKNLKD